MFLSHLSLGFDLGVRAACSPVCFDLSGGLGDEIAAIAFVRGKFTEDVDLTFKDIEKT